MKWLLIVFSMIIPSGISLAQTDNPLKSKIRLSGDECRQEHESLKFAILAGQLDGRVQEDVIFFPDSKEYIEIDPIDLSVISLEIETNKKSYLRGEPIGVRQYIRNVSDQPLFGNQLLVGCTSDSKQLILKDPRGRNVSMIYPIFYDDKEELELMAQNPSRPYTSRPFLQDLARSQFRPSGYFKRGVRLKPGERMLIYPSGYGNDVLNHFFNLTEVGTYELTFCRKIVHEDGTIEVCDTPKPCTVSFEVRGGFYSPEWDDDDK